MITFPECTEITPVIPVESVLGTEPHKAFRILQYTVNSIFRQSIIYLNLTEMEIGVFLRVKIQGKKGSQKNSKNQ
jgi:hypothetical protein